MVKEQHAWIFNELEELNKLGLIDKPRKRGGKGYADYPIKWSVSGYFTDMSKKEYGAARSAFVTYSTEQGSGIISMERDVAKSMENFALQRVLQDKGYVTYRKEQTDKYAAELFMLCEKIKKSSKTKAELWNFYNEFKEIYIKFEFYNGIWFLISDALSEKIIDRLSGVDFEDLQALMTPTFQSFTNKERIALLQTALQVKEKGFEACQESIQKLVDDFHWIPFGHVGPELFDQEHYRERIKELLGKDLNKELDDALYYCSRVQKEHERIIAQYSIDTETVRLLHDLHILMQLQDERKEIIAKTHIVWIDDIMTPIGSYFNLTPQQAANLEPEVIEKCLTKDLIDLDEYKLRSTHKRRFAITQPDGVTTYYNEDAETFLKVIEHQSSSGLKGKCASMGKAVGKVRILIEARQLERVEEGDILVTTMTTPDFVPAMIRAGAIVTDEGGVTCHAAIVSRELNKPCIINTKNATETLKEGEMIEVDATNGIIRRIS